jgi:hypothetical protein
VILPVCKWPNLFKDGLGLTREKLLWVGQIKKIHLEKKNKVKKIEKISAVQLQKMGKIH